jgi:hypothetical protein
MRKVLACCVVLEAASIINKRSAALFSSAFFAWCSDYCETFCFVLGDVVVCRNERGMEMWELLRSTERLVEEPTTRGGAKRQDFVKQTLVQDDDVQLGADSKQMPMWLGNILADVLTKIGPQGLEFAAYSIDYHVLRNFLLVYRKLGKERAYRHMPAYAKKIVQEYSDLVEPRLALKPQQKDPQKQEQENVNVNGENGGQWKGLVSQLLVGALVVFAATLSVWVSSALIFSSN